jgi:Family of unknown function (DUF6459)
MAVSGLAGTAPRRPRKVTAPPGRNDPRRGGARRTDPRRPGEAPTRPAPRGGDMRRWFAQALVDTLAGRRPAATLMRVTSADVYQRLWALADEGLLRVPPRDPSPKVITCRHSAPAPGVLEVGAVVWAADRSRALAFRLERDRNQRWRCTALETG